MLGNTVVIVTIEFGMLYLVVVMALSGLTRVLSTFRSRDQSEYLKKGGVRWYDVGASVTTNV